MPTSHNMIIYALAASGKASIGALFLAGLFPALLLSLCNLGAAYDVAVNVAIRPCLAAARGLVAAVGAAVPGLLVMVIILGGVVSGIFTATESAWSRSSTRSC